MTTTAVLFPGQGAQRPRMLHDLPPEGRAVLDEASRVLGEDTDTLDTDQSLAGTRGTQLALLLAGTAWHRAARAAGMSADYLAGHSLGLWTAAVAADALDLADAVALVDLRARAMAASAPPSSGMLAAQGVGPAAVEALTAELRALGHQVWAANTNGCAQVTASGTDEALDLLTARLPALGARRVVRLPVAVPAHCPLMAPAAQQVADALSLVEIRRPRVPVAGNLTGQTLFDAGRLRTELSAGMTRGVRWSTAVQVLAERGVTRWIQAPPGRDLLDFGRLPGQAVPARICPTGP
ncbi:acyltransferase domain-containing protein [Streptomyces sp. NBC_01335]|uniref:ACP S-malonyltransferase n=1 Tax=Streptomyces sp. NBC_01335 TaxID=2903828 RepID=UPI002E135A10|nr:acyltransferase domain-containing protein [Streptomyces sp. NBC_01335]